MSQVLTLKLELPASFRGYLSAEIPQVWDIARPHILRALERDPTNRYTINDVYTGLMAAEMQLWMWNHDAALVTTIQSDGDKTWCLLLVCGGKDMWEWVQYQPAIEEFARLNGATELRIYGRPGWARVAGFKIDYARMSRSV